MYHGEKFNSITHLAGAILALIGFGALLTKGIQSNDPRMLIGFSVFGVCLVLLYTMSTLYHSFSSARIKRIFRKLDHVAIYLLIAGTYTPFMLVSLGQGNGPYMLTAIWALAACGILLDVIRVKRLEILQITIYLLMGWICLLEYENLKHALSLPGLVWLTVGGVVYTLGVVFYVLDDLKKLTHAHGIWHLFVLVGSTSHFISVIGYVR